MVKIDVRGIAFDCDQTIYFPGQVISGEICLQSSGHVKLRRILVRIYGRAETRVEEVIKSKMRSCKRDHRDHHNILDYNVTVWEKGKL